MLLALLQRSGAQIALGQIDPMSCGFRLVGAEPGWEAYSI